MQRRRSKDSFLTVAEILAGAIEACCSAEAMLRARLDRVQGPHYRVFEGMCNNEQELIGVLSRFAARAPQSVLETRFQYTLDTLHQPEPRDALQAADQMIDINQHVVGDLEEQVRKVAPESVESSLEGLLESVDSIARRISLTRVTMYDN